MKILIVLIVSLVFTSFTYAGVYAKLDGVKEGNLHESDMNKDVAENKKAQSEATDFLKLGDIKGELHESDMNKNNQAVEDRYRKVGSGVLINTESPNKGKPGSKKPGFKNPTTDSYCTGYC
ncbi:MAG: hypothetical protein P8J18_05495 [Halieaceae bacterium]|nr:hypothetical protein [Halieaceae bacterium]